MKTTLLAAIIFFQALILASDSDTTRFDRKRTFDVQHYDVELSFDRKKKRVFADATIHLTPLSKGFRTVELDAVNIEFSSISLSPSNDKLTHKYDRRKLIVNLPRAFNPGERISVRMKYSAKPKKGIYFVGASDKGDQVKHSEQVWTQGESQETSHWLPSFDFPSDRVTTETKITTEKRFTVIGNGRKVSDEVNGTKRTVHHKMETDHPLYLLSFVVGEFARVEDKYGDLPMAYYIYPGLEQRTEEIFGRTKKMMSVFEELTGMPYPFNKYDQVMVADFAFGGMENITATTYSDSELLFAPRKSADDLIAHELAHAWFGNLVTCRNWAELWTNEGFASFMEAAFREKSDGAEAYQKKILTDANQYFAYNASSRNALHGLFNTTADPITETTMFDPVTYNKGSVVIHMLRREIGEKAFWSGMRLYLKTNKLGLVGRKEVQDAFEKTSGRDLEWFFDQWVVGIGHPRVLVNQSFDKKTGELTLNVTQKASNGSKSLYRLPLDFEIRTSQKTFKKTLVLEEKKNTLRVNTAIPPELVQVDPRKNIPLAEITLRPTKIR